MNTRFEAVDRRFDAVDHRFAGVDGQLGEITGHFDAIYQRFDKLETEYHMIVAGTRVADLRSRFVLSMRVSTGSRRTAGDKQLTVID